MALAKDIPSESNLSRTKRAMELALKADLNKAMDIIVNTMTELLSGIEDIFTDPLNPNNTEMGTLDLVLGGKMVLKFFKSLSTTDEGLFNMIEDLRVWECSSPLVKKDRLNALIDALKALKAPVMAGTVVRLVKEGIPTRLDHLVEHLMGITEKELGPIDVIPVAPWQQLSVKSSIEGSDTSVGDRAPMATSSRLEIPVNIPTNDTSTRMTLDKLKQKIRNASSKLIDSE